MNDGSSAVLYDKAIVDFFYELGQLKVLPRSGWQLLGIKRPETIGAHVSRSTPIAYVLGKLEGVNADRAALIAAFHEFPETRIGDLHKVAQAYITDKKEIEASIVKEQVATLPPDIKEGFLSFYAGFENDASPEHTVARDADFLEVVLQAKEYLAQGVSRAQNWIDNTWDCLRTKSAKRLMQVIVDTSPSSWAENLKKIER